MPITEGFSWVSPYVKPMVQTALTGMVMGCGQAKIYDQSARWAVKANMIGQVAMTTVMALIEAKIHRSDLQYLAKGTALIAGVIVIKAGAQALDLQQPVMLLLEPIIGGGIAIYYFYKGVRLAVEKER